MKPEVEAALRRAGEFRRAVLGELSSADKQRLLEALFVDFFVDQWKTLLKWAALTGQSAQVDTGYIAQHTASILLAEPGQGFKGKGVDLLDGSEVKSAAIISGVDRPRWNHNLGHPGQDAARQEKGRRTAPEEYLSSPNIFYLLFDRVVTNDDGPQPLVLRVRAWCLDGQEDTEWRALLGRFIPLRTTSKYNLQLHPPVGYDDDIVVNELGNLDLRDVKVLEARLYGLGADDAFGVEWVVPPGDNVRPVIGRTIAQPYMKGVRPSRLSTAADVLPDTDTLRQLLPDHDIEALVSLLQQEILIEDLEEVVENPEP